MNMKNLSKPLLLIFVIILFCSVLAHVFSGSETLSEYAAKHPEAADSQTQTAARRENTLGTEASRRENTLGTETSRKENTLGTETARKENTLGTETARTQNGTQDGTNNRQASPHNNNTDSSESSGQTPVGREDAVADKNSKESEEDSMEKNPERVEYKQGFYYEPLSEDLKKRITGISYPAVMDSDSTGSGGTGSNADINKTNLAASADEIRIAYEDLCHVSIQHYNFKGIEKTGELICNRAIAQDLLEIFYELYQNQYQIEQVRLIDEYGADDTLSMQDNNTSCFNYRVVDGTSRLSKHALGLAIDINPFFNPYVEYQADGTVYISPKGGETYADRSKEFAYKIDENDLCYRLFKEHGFVWGGDWNSCKDYQHFQKTPE